MNAPLRLVFSLGTALCLSACNVVPPLDCVVGVDRPGCQRDANGSYRYLFTSPLVPAPNSDAVPVGFVPFPPASSGAIESTVDGDYNGWDGETVYRLSNGQVWQQAAYHYHYHYAFAPAVLIYQSPDGLYRMHVLDDADQDVPVTRLR